MQGLMDKSPLLMGVPHSGGKMSASSSDDLMNVPSSHSLSGFAQDRGAKLDSISDLIHEPICSGFLFKYCEEYYCSENIRFVMEVDKYRDFFLPEQMFWHKSWREIDLELDSENYVLDRSNTKGAACEIQSLIDDESLTNERTWPSRRVSRTVVEGMAKYIWETFLSDKSDYQICVPSRVLWNTMRRMRFIHLYGKEVFHEALIEPVKTIHRDIYPRFRNSEHMRALRRRVKELENLPPSSELHLPALPLVITKRYKLAELQNGVPLTLQDMLDDRLCFREFFRYLQSCIVSENLRFIRALQVFKSLSDSRDKTQRQQAEEWAWRIYKFFIAPYSAYEISVSDKTRRDVMRQLADPKRDIFDTLERTTMDMLRVHFNNFRGKKEYAALNGVLLDAVEFQGDDSNDARRYKNWGCWGTVS